MSLHPPPLTAALISYLSARLPDVNVATRVPNPTPQKFIRLGAGDGSRDSLIMINPVVLFECWAPDSVAAEELANDAWSAIDDLDGAWLGDVWVQSAAPRIPYDFPDPTYDTRNRWQFYCQMVVSLDGAKETA